MGIIEMKYIKAKDLEKKGVVKILPSQIVKVVVDELPKPDLCIECQNEKKCTIQDRFRNKDVVKFWCEKYKSK